MALNPSVVPNLLIPFFQSGVMKQLLNIADKFGTGLNLFNALRKAWPRDPNLSGDTYNQLLGWITTFTGRAIQGGAYINNLASTGNIDPNMIPCNSYLRKPSDNLGNFFVQVTYTTVDSESGRDFDRGGYIFVDAPDTKGSLLSEIRSRINEELDYVAATNNRDLRYRIKRNSIKVEAAVRMC